MIVLIVDGSGAVRARLREILSEHLDIEVREAADASAAIAATSARQIDLVILDIQLPASDGLVLLSTLRSSRVGAPRVVLVLTNDASEAHGRECRARGADLFFDKSRDFERAIDQGLELARARRSAPGADA